LLGSSKTTKLHFAKLVKNATFVDLFTSSQYFIFKKLVPHIFPLEGIHFIILGLCVEADLLFFGGIISEWLLGNKNHPKLSGIQIISSKNIPAASQNFNHNLKLHSI
jgi:hypothetical protein